MADNQYKMSLSLNVLNHLGINLYSNRPAVLAEVIANAWDADARNVYVTFDIKQKTITIADDGYGMDLDDVNSKYLLVGYKKRDQEVLTPSGRKPMGRKGIGKLSLFSIAKKASIYSVKKGCTPQAFLMDADKIHEVIESEDPSVTKSYNPVAKEFDKKSVSKYIKEHGTIIRLDDLKKMKLDANTIQGLRKRIARRFGLVEANDEFCIHIDEKEVTFSDRDYFHKARFLFQYGQHDYAAYCSNLDRDEDGNPLKFDQDYRFNLRGEADADGKYEISGWIAIAHHSHDLDDKSNNDNLNKITIMVRGKVAQEDILQDFRMGGLITKYIYGEIHADFLDTDDEEDIATSSRQRISEDDPRYQTLQRFIKQELQYIWKKTNVLKEQREMDTAMDTNPHVKEWYEDLKPKYLQLDAKKLFGAIGRIGVEESAKPEIYANGILAFETLKMKSALAGLQDIDDSKSEVLLEYLSDIDSIDAARYHEIIEERLTVISELRERVDEDVLERRLQEYIFDHLWLLDPAWERATEQAEMEKTIIDGIKKKYRLDITYRRVMGGHVIVELKRAGIVLKKTDIEDQIKRYIQAVKDSLNKMNVRNPQVEAVCIVGELPSGWKNPEIRKNDEESLRPLSIRIITYDELINNAYSAYSKFIQATTKGDKLREVIDSVRNYKAEP